MKRQIINIDEDKCDGCGLCIPECKEGAIQIINGKAKLISDLFCDGLGACLGYCPQNAITIEEREAEPYNEVKVLENIAGDQAVLKAHMLHLLEHNDREHYDEAIEFLKANDIPNPILSLKTMDAPQNGSACGCSGSRMIDLNVLEEHGANHEHSTNTTELKSELKQWPVQLHLVPPNAPYFKNKELVIMSTCGPIANANVHAEYLKGRSVVVACPKLDYTEPYADKLGAIFAEGATRKAIVVIMEVPCCKGLTKMVFDGAAMSGNNNLEVEEHILGLDGKLKQTNIVFSSVPA